MFQPQYIANNPTTPITNDIIPMVVETGARGERAYDIYSRLLMDRIVFLGSSIDDTVANIIVAQLLFLDADDPERDISVSLMNNGKPLFTPEALLWFNIVRVISEEVPRDGALNADA